MDGKEIIARAEALGRQLGLLNCQWVNIRQPNSGMSAVYAQQRIAKRIIEVETEWKALRATYQ